MSIERYHDRDGDTLSLLKAVSEKQLLVSQISDGSFNPKKWESGQRNKYKFVNYKIFYLEKMKARTELKPGSDGWLSIGSYQHKEATINTYLSFLDKYDVADISYPLLEDFKEHLGTLRKKHSKQEYFKDSFKKKIIDNLMQVLNWAYKRGDIVAPVPKPSVRVQKKRKKGLNGDQQAEILHHIPEEDIHIFIFLEGTSRRMNEARAVKIKDVNFKQQVHILSGAFNTSGIESYKDFPKDQDKAGLEFPLSAKVMKAVRDSMTLIPNAGPSSYIFQYKAKRTTKHCKKGERTPYTHPILGAIYKDAATKAGYPTVTLNVFVRHSMAQQLKNAGVSSSDTASILGNTKGMIDSVYAPEIDVARKTTILNMRQKRAK